MFEGKKILVTGGTGSFGHQIVNDLIPYRPALIRVFSRDEKKQHDMRLEYPNVDYLEFVIGDVRDIKAVEMAMHDIDLVFNAAALKQVPSCEYHSIEAVKTNILGAQNVIEVALEADVDKVIGISTDKACEPINAMGISKAMQERLFIAANLKTGRGKKTVFACIRYGNVLGSRGSVVPVFKQLAEQGRDLTLTDKAMTRFIITLPQSIELVFYAAKHAVGGEVFVKKMPAHTVSDLAEIMKEKYGKPEQKIIETGIRPGEKIHESLVSPTESLQSVDREGYFIILPQLPIPAVKERYGDVVKKVNQMPGSTSQKMFRYSSENTERLNKEQLKELLKNEGWL